MCVCACPCVCVWGGGGVCVGAEAAGRARRLHWGSPPAWSITEAAKLTAFSLDSVRSTGTTTMRGVRRGLSGALPRPSSRQRTIGPPLALRVHAQGLMGRWDVVQLCKFRAGAPWGHGANASLGFEHFAACKRRPCAASQPGLARRGRSSRARGPTGRRLVLRELPEIRAVARCSARGLRFLLDAGRKGLVRRGRGSAV
jgi:hypothetical protein